MLNLKNIYKKSTDYLGKIIKSFGLTEKAIFIILSLILLISSLSLFWKVNLQFVTEMPAHGGSLTEGLIGSPRFINPLLELSDGDRDLTYLVYSGLMRATASGDLIPDLAESYTVSTDGLTYTFKLRPDIYFHDGEKVTTDDVEYTIQMAQDINLRSPKRSSWTGVEIEKLSQTEIAFKLKQPYSPFLENTTLGIMPKNIWGSATIDQFSLIIYNTEPIGSGPYKISKITKDKLGIPTNYELTAFNKYTLGEPFITTIKFNFYASEKALTDAYTAGEIDSTSALSPQIINELKSKNSGQTEKISLPRIFGLFFNQNQAKIFLNKEVRTALNMTVDKDRIVAEVLNGYGQKIDGPLPNGVLSESKINAVSYNRDQAITDAKDILTRAGWKYNETDQVWEKKISKTETQKLAFSISTSNTSDLKKTADILKEDWGLLGVKVEIQTFDPSDLNQSVIAQRKYDTLLFGQIVSRSLDLFAFWHSSQRNTGYNVAMYTNSKADTLLEDARQMSDKTERLKKYSLFEKEVLNDIPAIFIYSPEFIYMLPNKILGFESGLINNRSERFEEVYKWYIEKDKIWNFLLKLTPR
jgi:peptide/nickel transport system substrate-binding protein